MSVHSEAPQSSAAPVRVFLCDDVAEIRVLMRFTVEEDAALKVVGEASDGDAGARGVVDTNADVILLDLSMPGMDGLEAIQMIRAASPGTGIVVLSGFSAARLGQTALDLGADRYLEKGEPGEAIRETIRAVAEERRS